MAQIRALAFVFFALLAINVMSFKFSRVLKNGEKNQIKAMLDRIREKHSGLNPRPVIGILTQPSIWAGYPADQYNAISTSYVKFIEAAGGRAAPVQWDQPKEDLEKLLGSLNGLLLAGGSNDAVDDNGEWTPYYNVNKFILQWAEKSNKNGSYFPIWAICQGFQYLAIMYANNASVLSKGYNDSNINHDQTFTDAAKTSRLFGGLPNWMKNYMETTPAVNYYHNYGVQPSVFNNTPLLVKNFNVLSIGTNNIGQEYIASMEHKIYPFYGVQFHPEKVPFEWINGNGVNHANEAVLVSQYMENFFNLETRRSHRHFNSTEEEYNALIYNFQNVKTSYTFSGQYFFPALHHQYKPTFVQRIKTFLRNLI